MEPLTIVVAFCAPFVMVAIIFWLGLKFRLFRVERVEQADEDDGGEEVRVTSNTPVDDRFFWSETTTTVRQVPEDEFKEMMAAAAGGLDPRLPTDADTIH